MATFKQIRGQTIKKYTTNPTNPLEGQMWYNNTTGTLKVYTLGTAAWASGTNYPTPINALRGAGTTNSAAFAVGGELGAPTFATTAATNTYDGSTWTGAPVIPSASRNAFAYGTQTAGLWSGGLTTPGGTYTNASAEFDGSTWTGAPTVPTSRGFGASSGVQTSALSTAGDQLGVPFGSGTAVDSYNGATWTSETAYPTSAYGVTGCGTSETEAFVTGGEVPYPGTNPGVATYNGSAWTLTATPLYALLPANTQQLASYGTSTDALAFGGTNQILTASWNGTAWASQPSMATGRTAGGAGTAASALAMGGGSTPAPRDNKTEYFTGAAVEIQTVTTS